MNKIYLLTLLLCAYAQAGGSISPHTFVDNVDDRFTILAEQLDEQSVSRLYESILEVAKQTEGWTTVRLKNIITTARAAAKAAQIDTIHIRKAHESGAHTYRKNLEKMQQGKNHAIVQIKVVPQIQDQGISATCGYNALKNGLMLYQYLVDSDPTILDSMNHSDISALLCSSSGTWIQVVRKFMIQETVKKLLRQHIQALVPTLVNDPGSAQYISTKISGVLHHLVCDLDHLNTFSQKTFKIQWQDISGVITDQYTGRIVDSFPSEPFIVTITEDSVLISYGTYFVEELIPHIPTNIRREDIQAIIAHEKQQGTYAACTDDARIVIVGDNRTNDLEEEIAFNAELRLMHEELQLNRNYIGILIIYKSGHWITCVAHKRRGNQPIFYVTDSSSNYSRTDDPYVVQLASYLES